MSREIREVKKGWEHPKKENGDYESLTEYDSEHKCNCEWCEVNDYAMPEVKKGDEFGYALYQTVSEGSPITPVFGTLQEVADYLVENGDFWGEKWNRESAQGMIKEGYRPSFVFAGGELKKPSDM